MARVEEGLRGVGGARSNSHPRGSLFDDDDFDREDTGLEDEAENQRPESPTGSASEGYPPKRVVSDTWYISAYFALDSSWCSLLQQSASSKLLTPCFHAADAVLFVPRAARTCPGAKPYPVLGPAPRYPRVTTEGGDAFRCAYGRDSEASVVVGSCCS